MIIEAAKTAGFCFGVNKAVKLVCDLIEKADGRIYTLGPIIHNDQVVNYLKKKGVLVLDYDNGIDEIEDLGKPAGIVIRAHGVAPDVYRKIEDKGFVVYDATCPYVKKIHKLVKEKHDEGYRIIIVGDSEHPEVKGINGWCGNKAFIAGSCEDIEALDGTDDPVCVVAQTTITKETWNLLSNCIKKKFKNIAEFDTICSATADRQAEAARIAGTADVMIVIGSRNSSNTQKLFDICKSICPDTYKIETAGDLPALDAKKIYKAGITAAASTPDWIFKEVVEKMEEMNITEERSATAETSITEEINVSEETSATTEEKNIAEETNAAEKANVTEKANAAAEVNDSGKANTSEEPNDSGKANEAAKANEKEMSFKEAFEESIITLKSGEFVKGKIIGYSDTEVYVDLGYKSDGIIPMEEFSSDPDFDPSKDLTVGEEIEAYIVRVNDGEGNVRLSKKKVDIAKGWNLLEEAYNNKLPVKVKIIEETAGGLIAIANGIRIFIPASQFGDRYVKDLKQFLKQTIEVRIIEFNREKRRVIASQRVILAEEKERRENEIWSGIEKGKRYTGAVKSLTDFGAFVDIGGVDGLVHITELSWSKLKHPSEVLKKGDKIEVYVRDFDRDKKRISLGYKREEDNPWNNIDKKYKVGDIVKGKVVRLVPFGAFIELENGIDGLVHISQISDKRIAKPGDALQLGQEVEAKVIELNGEAKKINLSIREANPSGVEAKKDENSIKSGINEAGANTEEKEKMV